MSKEEKHTLKGLVAMHNKAEYNLLDSFNAEAVRSANRMLRKVDTDELGFDACCDEFDER